MWSIYIAGSPRVWRPPVPVVLPAVCALGGRDPGLLQAGGHADSAEAAGHTMHAHCQHCSRQERLDFFFFIIVGEGLSEDRASFKINFYFWLGTWSQMSSLLCGFFSPPPPTHWSCSRRPQVSVCGLRFCCGAAYSRVHMEGQNLDFLKNGSVQDCKIQRKKILVHIRQ